MCIGLAYDQHNQAFFVLSALQFPLPKGNVYYIVMGGTWEYQALQLLLDVVEQAGVPRRRARARRRQSLPSERRRQKRDKEGACNEMDHA